MDISSIEENVFIPIEKNIIKYLQHNTEIKHQKRKRKRKRKRNKIVRTVLYISDSSDDEL